MPEARDEDRGRFVTTTEWWPNDCPMRASHCPYPNGSEAGFAEGDITLTGRTQAYSYRAKNPSGETTGTMREYSCALCGHIGLSTNKYLAKRELS